MERDTLYSLTKANTEEIFRIISITGRVIKKLLMGRHMLGILLVVKRWDMGFMNGNFLIVTKFVRSNGTRYEG